MTDTTADSTPAPTADEIAAAKAQQAASQAILDRAAAAEKAQTKDFAASDAFASVLTQATDLRAALADQSSPMAQHLTGIVTCMTNLKNAVA